MLQDHRKDWKYCRQRLPLAVDVQRDSGLFYKGKYIVGVKAVNQDNELMLITTEGIIIRIKVSDTTLLGRITSGVKLINLDENVTVASIAKVREDKSLIDNADTSELLSEEEEKESAAIAAENAKKASVENTETDDELMKELLERAEADGSEDEEE